MSPIDVLKLRSKDLRDRICKWHGNEGIELPSPNDDDNLLHELESCENLLSIVMADPMLCERYKIEAKNAELKNAHGYDRADSYGISAMELQGAVTIFVVNLKRIMKMMAK